MTDDDDGPSWPINPFAPLERAGEGDLSEAVAEVACVYECSPLDLFPQGGADRAGEHRHAVPASLPVAHDDPVHLEVDVLDAEAEAFAEPQPGSIEQARHEAVPVVEVSEEPVDLVPGEHDRDAPRPACGRDAVECDDILAEHVAIEEEDGVPSDVLCGGADVAFHCEMGEEGSDLCRAHAFGVTDIVIVHIPADPVDVRLLRAQAVVPQSARRADAVEEPWSWLGRGGSGHEVALVRAAGYTPTDTVPRRMQPSVRAIPLGSVLKRVPGT